MALSAPTRSPRHPLVAGPGSTERNSPSFKGSAPGTHRPRHNQIGRRHREAVRGWKISLSHRTAESGISCAASRRSWRFDDGQATDAGHTGHHCQMRLPYPRLRGASLQIHPGPMRQLRQGKHLGDDDRGKSASCIVASAMFLDLLLRGIIQIGQHIGSRQGRLRRSLGGQNRGFGGRLTVVRGCRRPIPSDKDRNRNSQGRMAHARHTANAMAGHVPSSCPLGSAENSHATSVRDHGRRCSSRWPAGRPAPATDGRNRARPAGDEHSRAALAADGPPPPRRSTFPRRSATAARSNRRWATTNKPHQPSPPASAPGWSPRLEMDQLVQQLETDL